MSRETIKRTAFTFALLLWGCFAGCQIPSSNNSNHSFFSPSATIPPPATGSYVIGDAVANSRDYDTQDRSVSSSSSVSSQSERNEGLQNPIQQVSQSSPSGQNSSSDWSAVDASQAADSPEGNAQSSAQEAQPFRSPLAASENTAKNAVVENGGNLTTNQTTQQESSQWTTAGSVAIGSAISSSNSEGMGDRIEIPISAICTDNGMRRANHYTANTRASSSVTQTAFIAPALKKPVPEGQQPIGPVQPGPVYANQAK